MKSRLNPRFLLILSFCSLFFLASCDKERSSDRTEEQQQIEASQVSSESDGEAEIFFNHTFDDVMGVNAEVAMGGTGVFGRTEACPDVTVTRLNPPALFPVRIVLTFPPNGCVGNDGHLRRGKIVIEYSNRLIHPNATAVTHFENFYIDSVKVEGTHTITNISPVVTGNPTIRKYRVDVVGAKLSKPNGNYTEWESHKTITQFEGLLTNIPQDDQFKIETITPTIGRTRRGNLLVTWQSSITEPLIKKFICRWIVKGEIKTVRSNTSATSPWVAYLNFGAGACDNLAIVTINGVPHQITLP